MMGERVSLPLGVTLYQGDCLEILSEIDADAVVMDPPYGYNYRSNRKRNYKANGNTVASHTEWIGRPIAGDEDTSSRDAVLAWAGDRPWAVFGSWRVPKPKGLRGVLVWDKGGASGMGDLSFPWKASWEEIYIGGQGWQGHRDEGVVKNCLPPTSKAMGRVHPNQKPVSLMCHLIRKLPEGCVVLDPFMGTGATIIAAIRCGRQAIGIECDPGYFEIARQRVEREIAQGDLFRGR